MTSSSLSEPAARASKSQCPILSVKEGLITIDVRGASRRKNEVGHIILGDRRLTAEILRIRGDTADMQVFEDTTGVKVGDLVEMTGELLSAQLGPGLLGQVYDGLQNPLSVLAREFGFFLPRGVQRAPRTAGAPAGRNHKPAGRPRFAVTDDRPDRLPAGGHVAVLVSFFLPADN